MADALQSAMLALNAPAQKISEGALSRVADPLAYRRLNDRHLDFLIGMALGAGLTVAPVGADSAALHRHGEKLWQTGVDRTASAFWQAEVDLVRAMKWHRDDRMGEIVVQTEDTLTFFGQVMPQLLTGHSHVVLLLDAVHDLCFRIAAQMKDIIRLPRPDVLAPDVTPCIATPAHGALPSGHGTEAFAAAAILGMLFPDRRDAFRRVAARIALNRSFAGVHYLVDHHAGAILGDLIAGHAAALLFGKDAVPDAVPHLTAGQPVPPVLGIGVEQYALSQGVLLANPSETKPATDRALVWLRDGIKADIGHLP